MTKLLHSKGIWWFFAALTVFVYFYALNIPLLGPDEPRYAQVAREMFDRRDWITPTLGGHNWFEKPALLYWLQVASYHVFGVTEFAARFGSAVFGLGTIGSLWLLGRFTTTSEQRSTNEFANWIALIAATSLGLMVFARGASFDIIVTFPLTASLVGFFIFDQADERNSKAKTVGLCSFYLFAGLAVVAKGLIGIVFPFAIVAFYFLLSRRLPSRRFLLSLVWGPMLMFAVAAIWNLPMYLQHGWEFIDEFYVQHHFQRYTSNKYLHPQPFYFFFWVLPLMTLPWLLFFFGGFLRAIQSIFHSKKEDSQIRAQTIVEEDTPSPSRSDILLFGFAWMAVPLVFFSISGSKLPGYILPAAPGTVLLTAVCVFNFVRKGDAQRGFVFGLALAMFVAVIAAMTFAVPKYADSDSVKRLIETADARGYSTNTVAGFRTVSHNAEFYANSRLIRDAKGRQRRFDDPADLVPEIRGSRALLVLVPMKQLPVLLEFDGVDAQTITDNASLAIVAVTDK